MSQQDEQKASFKESGQITLFYKKVVEDLEDVRRVAAATETLCKTGRWWRDVHTHCLNVYLWVFVSVLRQCCRPHAKSCETCELRLL